MSKEHRQPRQKPEELFGLTERKRSVDRVSHERLMEIVGDSNTTVHKIEETHNDFGSFLFVTVSKQGQDRRILMTFWGQGFHESRERWLMDEWFWYKAHSFAQTLAQHIPNAEAIHQIEEHRASISHQAQQTTQTKRGAIFELIADLTDDDGAMAELQDLPWWLLADDDGD